LESEDSMYDEKEYFDMACINKIDEKEQKFYRNGTMRMNMKTAAEMESIKLGKIFKVAENLK
jgi:hypothetical protein